MKALTKLWSELTAQEQLASHREEQDKKSSKEVKLSLVDAIEDATMDLISQVSELEGLIQDFDQYMDRASLAYRDMEQLADQAYRNSEALEGDIDEARKAAENLGLNINAIDAAEGILRKLDEAYGDAEERIRKFNL